MPLAIYQTMRMALGYRNHITWWQKWSEALVIRRIRHEVEIFTVDQAQILWLHLSKEQSYLPSIQLQYKMIDTRPKVFRTKPFHIMGQTKWTLETSRTISICGDKPDSSCWSIFFPNRINFIPVFQAIVSKQILYIMSYSHQYTLCECCAKFGGLEVSSHPKEQYSGSRSTLPRSGPVRLLIDDFATPMQS